MTPNHITNYILAATSAVIIPYLIMLAFWLHGPNVLTLVGAIIAISSLMPLIVARVQLGKSFSLTPQATELVTTGLYSRIRHPVYVFAQLMLLGLVLCFWRFQLLLLWVLLLILQIARSHREEKVLEETFGDSYREYREKTWF